MQVLLSYLCAHGLNLLFIVSYLNPVVNHKPLSTVSRLSLHVRVWLASCRYMVKLFFSRGLVDMVFTKQLV